MKKLTSFALAGLGLLSFFSCKKDKNNNSSGSTVDSVAVIGKWQVARDVSYFYASSSGSFLDSVTIPAGSQNYFEFEKGDELVTYDVNATPSLDTVTYEVARNKYLVVEFLDTVNLKLSANADTMLLTKVTYNTTDFQSPVSATEADTILLVK